MSRTTKVTSSETQDKLNGQFCSSRQNSLIPVFRPHRSHSLNVLKDSEVGDPNCQGEIILSVIESDIFVTVIVFRCKLTPSLGNQIPFAEFVNGC